MDFLKILPIVALLRDTSIKAPRQFVRPIRIIVTHDLVKVGRKFKAIILRQFVNRAL